MSRNFIIIVRVTEEKMYINDFPEVEENPSIVLREEGWTQIFSKLG